MYSFVGNCTATSIIKDLACAKERQKQHLYNKRIASHFCVPSSLEKAKIAFVHPWRLTIVRPTTRIKLVNKCIFFKEIPSIIFQSDSCCSIFVQRRAFSLIFSLILLDYSRSSVSSCTRCGPTSLNPTRPCTHFLTPHEIVSIALQLYFSELVLGILKDNTHNYLNENVSQIVVSCSFLPIFSLQLFRITHVLLSTAAHPFSKKSMKVSVVSFHSELLLSRFLDGTFEA